MSFRFPYLALDLETTGLDRQQSHVLQLAAIYDDGSHLEGLPTFDVVIKYPVITYGEAFAMNMNRDLLQRGFDDRDVTTLELARGSFQAFLNTVQPEGKITVAGKNVGGFDVPILNNSKNGFDTSRFTHRTLDPGSMFSEYFEQIPSLGQINKLTGRDPVQHDALEDCWDVVHAVRYKWGV